VDRPPLVLINGYAATVADWDPSFLTALGETFTLICPENRGMGDAPLGDPAALTIDAMATDVEVLLDERGVERAAVAGWSMGGFVAQRLTARSPAQVASLTLLATDPGGDAAIPAAPDVWARLTDHSGTPREQASRLIALLFPPEFAAMIDREFGDVVASARAALSTEALSAQEAAMAAWHATPQPPVGAESPPVLIVHGDSDVVIPPPNADALASHWPGSRMERFAGGGHAFMAQEPDRVAGLIADFASP